MEISGASNGDCQGRTLPFAVWHTSIKIDLGPTKPVPFSLFDRLLDS